MIDKNAPLPKSSGPEVAGRMPRGENGGTSYPWPDMEVGDSVFYDGYTTRSKQYASAMMYGPKHGKKFIGRKEANDEGGYGLRIWRVE